MDRKRLKVALVDLDAVKSRFPDTKEFIDDTLKEKCEATESKELNKKAEEIQESEEAAKVVKQDEDIIKTKRQ